MSLSDLDFSGRQLLISRIFGAPESHTQVLNSPMFSVSRPLEANRSSLKPLSRGLFLDHLIKTPELNNYNHLEKRSEEASRLLRFCNSACVPGQEPELKRTPSLRRRVYPQNQKLRHETLHVAEPMKHRAISHQPYNLCLSLAKHAFTCGTPFKSDDKKVFRSFRARLIQGNTKPSIPPHNPKP